MTARRWEKIKAVFDSALEAAPEDRPSYIENACGGDHELRQEVARLLVEFEKSGSFLEPLAGPFQGALSPGELLAERYRVVQILGRGGMGEVYEADDQLLNERVALKVLRGDLSYDQSLARRFQSEIQLARKVTHPHVCRVFEAGVHEFAGQSRPPLLFFSMQLLQGETLAARIQRAGPLAAKEAFPLIVQMAEGLQAAHNEGVIHRDFKSANVMISGGRAVITDFGLAGLEPGRNLGATAGSVSAGMRIAGTVAFMSPEQMSGDPITASSDIYSFGVVLFEMATGRLPFAGDHIVQAAIQRVRGQVPSIRETTPDIDSRWESAIRRCLEVDPNHRFRKASELAALFQERSWRPPPIYWSRRKWAQFTAVAALPLAAGAVYWRWLRLPYQPTPEALAWYERGVEALRSATFEAARRDLEKAVSSDPLYAPAYASLAAAYSDLDSSERAKDTMLQAITAAQDKRLGKVDTLRVEALRYVISRNFERARPLMEQLCSTATDREQAGCYVDLAWLAWKRQDTAAMIPPLEQALKLNPGHAGAKLWMAFAVERQGRKELAQTLFADAEALFQTASDYDGVVETLLQQSISLARANRPEEAAVLINRGMAVAASTGDLHHEVQLRLALALAYRTMGQTEKSQQIAEAAVKTAVEDRMDQPAAVGLLDLGNAYFQRDEPEQAERYFRQGLDFASRSRARFSEARAQLSLGSLCSRYDRPTEVPQFVRPALTFFRGAGYQRESMQAVLVLGGAQETLAEFAEAEKTDREAIQLASQLREAEQAGLAHFFLGSVLMKVGRWPESIAEMDRAIGLFGDVRGGYRAAFAFVARARLRARMGNFDVAGTDLEQARTRVEKLEGRQAGLRAQLVLVRAEMAAYQLHWPETGRLAREALGFNGGIEETVDAQLLAGLTQIYSGSLQSGIAACRQAIRGAKNKTLPYVGAMGSLALAEALSTKNRRDEAGPFGEQALAFFEPLHNWEVIWRCHRVLQGDRHASLARTALEQWKRLWPEGELASYLARPDLKNWMLP
jgi:tetratricopeptide (TPR) repeat protein